MPAKASASGPMAAVKFISDASTWMPRGLKLPTVLNDEVAKYNNEHLLGVAHLDDVARTWFSVYHAVVWLGAATNYYSEPETLWGPFTNYVISEHHHVSAFYPEEGGQEGDAGWFFDEMKNRFTDFTQSGDTERGKRFPVSVLQTADVNGTEQPLLKHFLTEVDAQRLFPDNFDLAATFEACHASTAEMTRANGYHHRARDFALAALDTIEPVLIPVSDHLAEIYSWLRSDSGSEEWLTTKLQIESLIELGIANYETLNDEAKLEIGRRSLIMEEISLKTFLLIYARLQGRDITDSIDGLNKVISRLTEDLSDSAKEAWQVLLSATYGSIAWHVFQQAEAAIQEVRAILSEV